MGLSNWFVGLGAFVLDIFFPRRVIVKNIFQKNYGKRVLICYLTFPFYERVRYDHTNGAECFEMARVFDNLKYQVDVCRYDSKCLTLFWNKNDSYEIIIGADPNFGKIIKKSKPKLSIYYATTSYWKFQNEAELRRLNNLSNLKGLQLKPRRQIKGTKSAELADMVVGVGNRITEKTYLGHCKKIFMIDVTGNPVVFRTRCWSKARNNFLWFGSVGAVHKGLDILLDVFSCLDDQHLYVCGNVDEEKDFVKLYKKELSLKNVHFIGWIHPMSKKFSDLSKLCGFVILPSCSEGMSSSVATCMRTGMIPLVTKECGITLGNDLIIGCSVDSIKKKIIKFSGIREKLLEGKSKKIWKLAVMKYNIKSYRYNLSKIIRNALKYLV